MAVEKLQRAITLLRQADLAIEDQQIITALKQTIIGDGPLSESGASVRYGKGTIEINQDSILIMPIEHTIFELVVGAACLYEYEVLNQRAIADIEMRAQEFGKRILQEFKYVRITPDPQLSVD